MTKSKQRRKKRTESQTIGKRRHADFVLTQMQMGLALGFVTIGFILAFGSGFIVGMWYQASEHIALYDDGASPAAEEPALGRPMTFYSTLTDRGKAPPPSAAAAPPTETLPAQHPRKSSATPVPQPPAPSVQGTKGRTRGMMNHPARRREPRTASEEAVGRSSNVHYSVQVGSFRTREQAERLRRRLARKGHSVRMQPSVIPGKGTWYRIRVGDFSNRDTAAQEARRLAKQERVSVMVTVEPR